MFGSAVLDVGIGVTLLFLFVSLICSALREAIETALKSRAMDLERGIREILHDRTGTQIAKALYDHPFVYSLYGGDYDPARLTPSRFANGGTVMPWRARTSLPAYIPSRAFSAALFDLVRGASDPDAPLSAASLRDGLTKIGNERLRVALTAALDAAGSDVSAARRNVEAWYDATMDRVSGWYKRRTQMLLIAIGLATAVCFNIDAITVARHLASDASYREAVVARAASFGTDGGAAEDTGRSGPRPPSGASPVPPASGTSLPADPRPPLDALREIHDALEATGFILGWPAPQVADCRPERPCGAGTVVQMVLGWVVTALAVSLGAPFWFDVLNKFMVVRSTVKPAEKSGQEASKDAWPSATGGADRPVPVMLVAAPPDPRRGAGGP